RFHTVTMPSPFHTSSPPFFFFTAPAPTHIYTLSLHDALPISPTGRAAASRVRSPPPGSSTFPFASEVRDPSHGARPRALWRRCRSEEHTSELQSRFDLVCRLLLEKKKKKKQNRTSLCTRHSNC